jgi:hypothetical protein
LALTSWITARGTTISWASAASSWIRSTLPSKINGEALTTQRLCPMDFVCKLIARDLAGRDLSAVKFFEEFRSGQVGKLGRFSLRDDPLCIPLNRCGYTHLSRELAGRQP